MVRSYLKCPQCNLIQTKGAYCVFDGCQLKTIEELEELRKSSHDRDSTDELNERFSKKIKIDATGSHNHDVINSCRDCVNDLISKVELNMIKETFKTTLSVASNSQTEEQTSRPQPL